VARPSLWLVFGLPALVCAAWSVHAGKDVNWDLLNYHYYLPYELLGMRLEQDFFAASAQSYLNPVGYLPFYLMVSLGAHSVLVSIVLAAAHSLSIGLLYLIAWRLFAYLPAGERRLFAALAAALGAATGVFWMTVGGSFLDPLLVPPLLCGLLFMLHGGSHAARRAAAAGALFGAAAALKYSNAAYALAALPLSLAMPGVSGALRLRACLAYVSAAALALAILAGPWLALLWHKFGNPVFPLMNGWFRSPDALPFNMIGERFAVHDASAVLAFPFRMVTLDPRIYAENFAPDLRFAALLLALLALAALAAKRGAPARGAFVGADWRVLAFFGFALTLWLAGSANGRYGMVVLLLVGVCVARAVELLLPPGLARIALAVLVIVQFAMTFIASPTRWFVAERWSAHWLPYVVPERAQREPALYLTVEILPMAVIAPLVDKDSSFVNFRGQHTLAADAPRLQTLLARYRGRVRTVGRELELEGGKPGADQVRIYDTRLRRLGYQVDPADCFAIPWRPDDEDWLSRAANWLAGNRPSYEPLSVASCALRAAPRDPTEIESERHASLVFDRVERACPRLFRGQSAVTEPLGIGWSRNYPGLDARLEGFGGGLVLHRYRMDTYVDLGRLADWERANPPLSAACNGG